MITFVLHISEKGIKLINHKYILLSFQGRSKYKKIAEVLKFSM